MGKFFSIVLIVLLSSCFPAKNCQLCSHLEKSQFSSQPMREDDYFIVILVDACHLNYTDATQFFQSVAIHPNGSRRGDVGHAWIYLQGKKKNGEIFVLEGGHSGEKEESPPRYFDGIMNYVDWGYADPTPEQKCHPRYEPNPIKYMWTVRQDGFFQKGSGGHSPTFAAKISLTRKQFEEILFFIRPSNYPYQNYALMGPQCCTFVSQVAALAGLSINCEITMHLSPSLNFRGAKIHLWEDPCYSTVSFSTPDMLEKCLMDAVENGQAEYALDWYLGKCIRLLSKLQSHARACPFPINFSVEPF